MKNGYMFFFNLGNITKMSRIFFVFGVAGLFMLDITEIMFWVCAVVSVVCFVLNLFRSPSDKDFLAAMEDFAYGFEKNLQNKYGIMSMDNVARVEGYVQNKRMALKRVVNNKVIYPCPAILGAINLHGEVMVFVGRTSMLKKTDAEYIKCDPKDEGFKISSEISEDEKVAFITVVCRELFDEITVAVDNNYHYRAFMEKVEGK